VSWFSFPDLGKRCAGTSVEPCTASAHSGAEGTGCLCANDDDCASGTCSAVSVHDRFLIANNNLYKSSGANVAFDFSTLGTSTRVQNGSIIGNEAQNFATGLKAPTDVGSLSGLGVSANDFTGTTTPIDSNWNDAMGQLVGNIPAIANRQFDGDATCDSKTIATGSDVTVAALPDYDNTNRSTFISGCVEVTSVGGSRSWTLKLKVEGTTVYAANLTGLAKGASAPLCGSYLDTTSASARTATMTVTVNGGAGNTVANCTLSRIRS
jgi:hypothetical protein